MIRPLVIKMMGRVPVQCLSYFTVSHKKKRQPLKGRLRSLKKKKKVKNVVIKTVGKSFKEKHKC